MTYNTKKEAEAAAAIYNSREPEGSRKRYIVEETSVGWRVIVEFAEVNVSAKRSPLYLIIAGILFFSLKYW